MRWDIFCQVIDNHGDLGVCWRLACQLATRGETVRLWIDDARALRWMAPQGCQGVSAIDWSDDGAVAEAAQGIAPDVLVEAFGCEPAPALIARFAANRQADGRQGVWINLEYLSAEPYVERLHTLPSPVFKGPGEGLTKHFFYPGFTPATGGLLREADLAGRRARFDRADWLAARSIHWHGERLVSLFCYEPPRLSALLAQWAEGATPTHLLVTEGRAAGAVRSALPSLADTASDRIGSLKISFLPLMPQAAFDELLWSCDFNFVRGEDSLVRAIWAGRPFAWQIYPQDDDAHHVKLEAFLHAIGAAPSLRAFHLAWNGIGEAAPAWPDDAALRNWTSDTQAARNALSTQIDLCTQLVDFVHRRR